LNPHSAKHRRILSPTHTLSKLHILQRLQGLAKSPNDVLFVPVPSRDQLSGRIRAEVTLSFLASCSLGYELSCSP